MPLLSDSADQRFPALQCIGCGRIESPQTCIGVCEDQRVDLVDATAYDALSEKLQQIRRERDEAMKLVSHLAHITPRDGSWKSSYQALQTRARRLLAVSGENSNVEKLIPNPERTNPELAC